MKNKQFWAFFEDFSPKTSDFGLRIAQNCSIFGFPKMEVFQKIFFIDLDDSSSVNTFLSSNLLKNMQFWAIFCYFGHFEPKISCFWSESLDFGEFEKIVPKLTWTQEGLAFGGATLFDCEYSAKKNCCSYLKCLLNTRQTTDLSI